jgi:alanine racemase
VVAGEVQPIKDTDRLLKNGSDIVRPVVARVDLGAIRGNVAYLKGLTHPGCGFMAVVKADGYGHGDIEVSHAALEAGADCLGVALLEEAERLRLSGFDCPVYLLFEPPPTAVERVISGDVTCSIYTEEFARALSAGAVGKGTTTKVHIKVDTGMHRVGVQPDSAAEFADLLKGLPGLDVEGIYTHFALATDPQDPFTIEQMDRFEQSAETVQEVLHRSLMRHAANSAATMAFPRSHYDMVRVGIAMLGLTPDRRISGVERLRPALSLYGEVSFVKRVGPGEGISYGIKYAPQREAYIATLPIGYADGMSRILNDKADVLIGGRRRPVVGVICMDACMVDLGDEPVEPGMRFTVIGRDGDEEITAEEIADKLGTINYEVGCMISQRVPRVYIGND